MPAGSAPVLAGYRPIEGSLEAYKREQSHLARRRLYPLTVFSTIYSLIVAIVLLRGKHPLVGIMFYLGGIPVWTLGKYLVHRYLFHRHIPPGQGLIRRLLHERLDPLHREHHESPFDGWHIGGELEDILPLFFVAVPFSFLFPVATLPALLAGVIQSCVGGEWARYFLHFGKFCNRLLRHVKRYHLCHHSVRGMEKGYRIASGICDYVFHMQYPKQVRRSLSNSGGHAVRVKKMTRSEALKLFRERFKQQ